VLIRWQCTFASSFLSINPQANFERGESLSVALNICEDLGRSCKSNIQNQEGFKAKKILHEGLGKQGGTISASWTSMAGLTMRNIPSKQPELTSEPTGNPFFFLRIKNITGRNSQAHVI
jgi:hypothetical protein